MTMKVIKIGGDDPQEIGGQSFDASRKTAEVLANQMDSVSHSVYVALMTGLGALTVAAALISKRPEDISHDSSEHDQTAGVVGMTNHDTVLLAALLARHMFDEAVHKGGTNLC